MEIASPPTIGPSKTAHLLFRVRDVLAAVGGGDLMDYIAVRRATTPPTPYRRIAIDLTNLTGVDITHEAPRRWYLDHTRKNPTESETDPE